jgi:hypothetical protein
MRRDTGWALTRRRCGPSMPLVDAAGRCRWGSEERGRCPAALAFRAVVAERSYAAAEWREGSGAAGRRPSGRQPAPDLVRQAPPPGSTVGAPCGSGFGRARLLVGWSEPGNQAKGGDAWWAAGRRAGRGRSASSPDRGSARAADAPAGPGATTPVRAPRRPATGAAGRAASTAGRSTATATCSIWSTAPGRWRRSSTGCGGPRGR